MKERTSDCGETRLRANSQVSPVSSSLLPQPDCAIAPFFPMETIRGLHLGSEGIEPYGETCIRNTLHLASLLHCAGGGYSHHTQAIALMCYV